MTITEINKLINILKTITKVSWEFQLLSDGSGSFNSNNNEAGTIPINDPSDKDRTVKDIATQLNMVNIDIPSILSAWLSAELAKLENKED